MEAFVNADSQASQDVLGTIVGIERSGLVVVRLADGSDVKANGKRLHRPLGFYRVPVGRTVRLRGVFPADPGRIAQIMDVLPEQSTQ
jgi:hypothetical protein